MNIYTGAIADDHVNIQQSDTIGKSMLATFLHNLPESFSKPINRQISLFNKKKVLTVHDNQVIDINVIFSRAMCLISSGDLDVKEIFSKELAYHPPSLFNDNGEPRFCTSKASLKQALALYVSIRATADPDAFVIDGSAWLWTIAYPSSGTVKDFVEAFFSRILLFLSRGHVYLIFDRYPEFSIKSCTRLNRLSSVAQALHITLETLIPTQTTLLGQYKNKIQLMKLIVDFALKNMPTDISNRLIITSDDPTPDELHLGVHMKRHDPRTRHEEADAIIPNQVLYALENGASCVHVICDDTDVFCLLLHVLHPFDCKSEVMMVSTKSQERTQIDIIKTGQTHSAIIPDLLAGHILSGCDTVPQMYSVGKKTMLKYLKDYPLSKLGEEHQDEEEIIDEALRHIAACYGMPSKDAKPDFSQIRFVCLFI